LGVKSITLIIYKIILLFTLLFSSSRSVGTSGGVCLVKPPIITALQSIACVNSGLRRAIEKENLLSQVANNNFFAHLDQQDVVRTVKSLSFFSRELPNKIKTTHAQYMSSDIDNYSLLVTSYPIEVKKGTCKKHKTIDLFSEPSQTSQIVVEGRTDLNIKKDVSAVYQQYKTVPGKKPVFFQLRKYKSKYVICEDIKSRGTPTSLREKCGKGSSCKNLPYACSAYDENGGASDKIGCVSLETFSKLSQDILFSSDLETFYCPTDCSYYTQMVQNLYKQAGSNNYCSDNYMIVHCGPKKASSDYNLNIRELGNFCDEPSSCSFY